MELPHLVYVLIAVVAAITVVVGLAMNRRRNHALRDRFEEEYERLAREQHGDRG